MLWQMVGCWCMQNKRWRDPFGWSTYLRHPGYLIGGILGACLVVLGVGIKGLRDLRLENQARGDLLQQAKAAQQEWVPTSQSDPELTIRHYQSLPMSRPVQSVRIMVTPTGYGVSVNLQARPVDQKKWARL